MRTELEAFGDYHRHSGRYDHILLRAFENVTQKWNSNGMDCEGQDGDSDRPV
jgi:hypothetical protein